MANGRNARSETKAKIIFDLMVSPRLRSEIISEYSKQSSKGVYRHLTDLESEKVIREAREKGARPILFLNKRDFTSTSKAFSYLLDAFPKIKKSFDRAFVECAISAYGDFPSFGPYLDDINMDLPYLTLNALGKAERPEITESVMAKALNAIDKIRGLMSIEDRLAYVTLIDSISNSDWSPDERSVLSRTASFLFSTAEREKREGAFSNPSVSQDIWDYVIRKIILMAVGKRKNFLEEVRDSKELKLMLARIQLYEASLLSVNEIDLREQLNRRFLTPELKAQFEKTKIKEISEMPEVYRKEAEQEQGIIEGVDDKIEPYSLLESVKSKTNPVSEKKKFRLFRSS